MKSRVEGIFVVVACFVALLASSLYVPNAEGCVQCVSLTTCKGKQSVGGVTCTVNAETGRCQEWGLCFAY